MSIHFEVEWKAWGLAIAAILDAPALVIMLGPLSIVIEASEG